MSNIVGNNSNVDSMVMHHKFTFSQFDNGNCVKLVFSWVVFFADEFHAFKTCMMHV
jgi:hypothetical protein